MPVRDHWIQLPTPAAAWKGFACSQDGKTVIGSGWYGPVYVSHNYGLSWTPVFQLQSANDFAISPDSKKIWAASYSGLYQSNDGGATWAKNSMTGVEGELVFYGWTAVRASADGSVIAVKSILWGFWAVSTNSGVSWNFRDMPAGSMAMSADAKTIIASGGWIPSMSVSHDYGVTWNTNNAPFAYWADLAISPDGRTIVALKDFYSPGEHTDPDETIYISRDGGDTWTGCFVPFGLWNSIVCSANAKTMMIIPAYNFLSPFYISTDGGKSWKVQNPGTRGWDLGACSANGKIMYASNFGVGTYIHFSK